MEITRREFLEGLPKTALKLTIASQALSGLASLVFGEEDYLSKLPPLNGRKVTEELIQEMLNVGSVKGILEKYGNKDNIFYVQFKPDGKNNLDELVRMNPEKWDGSYVLISENNFLFLKDSSSLKQAIVTVFLSYEEKNIKFIFYDTQEDKGLEIKQTYVVGTNHPLHLIFKKFFEKSQTKDNMSLPARLLYGVKGGVLDGGAGGAPLKNEGIRPQFTNEGYWLEHWLYSKWQKNENGMDILIRYNFTDKLKEEKR